MFQITLKCSQCVINPNQSLATFSVFWNVIHLERSALSIGVWVTGKLWDQLSMSSPAFEKLEYIVISMSKWCLMGFFFQKECVSSMIRTFRGSFLECLLIYKETQWHLKGTADLWCVTHKLPPWAFLLILLLSVSCSFLFMHGFQNMAFLLIKVLFSLVYIHPNGYLESLWKTKI